jgi:hypothetical protein
MEPNTASPPDNAAQAASGPEALERGLAGLEQRLDRLIQTRLDAAETRQKESSHAVHLNRFAAAHPDFLERQADGTLDALRAGNPLLDEVGAYLAHRLEIERREAATTLHQARQEAATSAEAALLERVKTKRLAATLGAAPAGANRGQGLAPELDQPERFGGLTTVLAARLEARRKAAGH